MYPIQKRGQNQWIPRPRNSLPLLKSSPNTIRHLPAIDLQSVRVKESLGLTNLILTLTWLVVLSVSMLHPFTHFCGLVSVDLHHLRLYTRRTISSNLQRRWCSSRSWSSLLCGKLSRYRTRNLMRPQGTHQGVGWRGTSCCWGLSGNKFGSGSLEEWILILLNEVETVRTLTARWTDYIYII